MTTYGAGTYTACPTCGRLLRIEWATRSIVCSCGARIPPTARDGDPAAKQAGTPVEAGEGGGGGTG